MNQPEPKSNGVVPSSVAYRFDNFEVCWAGPNPFREGFCFGAEEGWMQLTDENGKPLGTPQRVSASGEAINSIVSSGGWLAVSTRQEVNFLKEAGPTGSLVGMKVPYGAHALAVTPSGYFVAALGRAGLMFVRPGSTPGDAIGISGTAKQSVPIYRVLTLQGDGGRDLLICAARLGGVGFTQWHPEQTAHNLGILSSPGFDAVDLCSIASESMPRAVAVLGKDGTLVLFHDVLHDKAPATMQFASVTGIAYRLISSRGHLFVLTSHGLHALCNVAARFVAGTLQRTPGTPILVLPFEAIDANPVGDRWLLVVMLDHVRRFDIEHIDRGIPSASGNHPIQEFQPQPLSPTWQSYGLRQTITELAATA